MPDPADKKNEAERMRDALEEAKKGDSALVDSLLAAFNTGTNLAVMSEQGRVIVTRDNLLRTIDSFSDVVAQAQRQTRRIAELEEACRKASKTLATGL